MPALQTAIFAGGCFWCVEAQFQRVRGVSEVKSGYSGGHREKITYSEVKSGMTGHHEVVKVTHDPEIIPFSKLLDVFFAIHDSTQENGQGEDIGSQYQSAVFYLNQMQKEMTLKKIQDLSIEGENVVTKVVPLQMFFEAEEYHQNYWNEKGKENAYCSIIPGKLSKLQTLFKEYYIES